MTEEKMALVESGMRKWEAASKRRENEPAGDIPMGLEPSVLSQDEADALGDYMLEDMLATAHLNMHLYVPEISDADIVEMLRYF